MAFLLGTQSCIDALRSDLKDIQDTIDEILVRTGPVKCYSWKSPDKLATDLKIKDLLDRFAYGRDEVDNQMSHYSLLELIVDRLLLLIHISTLYTETSMSSAVDVGNLTSAVGKTATLSAGLGVKKFWNKFTQICSTLRQLNCQNKIALTKKKPSLEDLRTSKIIVDPIVVNNNNNNQKSTIANKHVSSEVSTKSVQTAETAFVPCESCAKIQCNLKQNADHLINMCHYQNITSQVGKYRSSLLSNQLSGGWLSGTDLDKWLVEQDKDLTRIAKQLDYLTKNNELIQAKLNDNEASVQKMVQAEKELKKTLKEEQESRVITTKQYEKKLTDQKSELNGKILSLESELTNLRKIKTSLEEKYEALKNLNDNNEKIIVELNETNKTLSDELTGKVEQKERFQASEEEKRLMSKELECLRRELAEKSQDLSNERLRLENLIRNEQSLKLKHDSSLESIDKLTADFDDLKRKFGYVDEEKKQLLSNIKHKENEIENLKYETEILQSSIDTLKLELKKQKDNEVLLLKYPDLYGPMTHIEDPNSETSSNDVANDMQNQINANKHRIYLLNNLNKKLENSVRKLSETTAQKKNSPIENSLGLLANGDSSKESNYFAKPPQSVASTPKSSTADVVTSNRTGLGRPVPFFKLESEIEQEQQEKQSRNELRPQSNTKFSIATLSKQPSFSHLDNDDADDDDLDLDNDDQFDFLKEKHESDKSYLSKLNQITNQSEMRVENTSDFNLSKNRRVSSRDHQATFLYSPSPNGVEYNNNNNISRPGSNYRGSTRNTNRTPPLAVNIPPAEKNMEVVVGKGRRVNSVSSGALGSNRANSAAKCQQQQEAIPARKNSIPLSNSSNRSFTCENCSKKYTNGKDLDIHKMYCNV